MKILHTADWHLGKRLDRFSRLQEQAEVMQEIVEIADREEVDLVLVAGDLFDAINPATEAVELFYKTLRQLTKDGRRPVVAIAGNHDSPNFINAPDPLARQCGIILVGYPKAVVESFGNEYFSIVKSCEGLVEIQLHSYDYPVRILHTPYANEVRLKQFLGEEKDSELNRVLHEHWHTLAEEHCCPKGVNLLMAHLYMNRRGEELLEEPEGEKPIKIGNADLIYCDAIPTHIQYTALGHLHGHKNIGAADSPVVYASSPLCYSFSEAGQTKSVSVVQVFPGRSVVHERHSLSKGKPLFRKSFDSVDNAVDWLEQNPDCWVELTMESDTFLSATERRRIFSAHDGIVFLIPKVKQAQESLLDIQTINPARDTLSLFKDYFKSKNAGQEPDEALLDLFNEILHS